MLDKHAHDGALYLHPLETIGSSVEWLLSHLTDAGAPLHETAGLSRNLQTLSDFRGCALNDRTLKFGTAEEACAYFAQANGADLLSKLLHRAHLAGLVVTPERLKCLTGGDPNPLAQAAHSLDRNLAWELAVASIVTQIATDVRLEEPDIRCRWHDFNVNIAAKVVYSPKTLWQRVVEGYEQAIARAADIDVVFVNVINLLPTVDTFRLSRDQGFTDVKPAVAWAKEQARAWCETRDFRKAVDRIQAKAKRPLLIAFFMPMLLMMPAPFGPMPFFYVHAPAMTEREDLQFAIDLESVFNVSLAQVR